MPFNMQASYRSASDVLGYQDVDPLDSIYLSKVQQVIDAAHRMKELDTEIAELNSLPVSHDAFRQIKTVILAGTAATLGFSLTPVCFIGVGWAVYHYMQKTKSIRQRLNSYQRIGELQAAHKQALRLHQELSKDISDVIS